jgi:hypothetical protein
MMTTTNTVTPIFGKNLSGAWANAFIRCWNAGGQVLAPGIVSFNVGEEDASWSLETPAIRCALDNQLSAFGVFSANQSNVETVAGTIFPESIWLRCNGNREKLFKEYEKMWPLVRKCGRNKRGTYFHRLTAFGEQKTNQLEKIIETWNSGIYRHSALQAGIFDPAIDHIKVPILGFPCLQQVVFRPVGTKGSGGMTVVAFYAKQLLLEKAYGNYLGLYRLGKFMAGEMGMRLTSVTCIASDLSLSDTHGKNECSSFVTKIKKELPDVA